MDLFKDLHMTNPKNYESQVHSSLLSLKQELH